MAVFTDLNINMLSLFSTKDYYTKYSRQSFYSDDK